MVLGPIQVIRTRSSIGPDVVTTDILVRTDFTLAVDHLTCQKAIVVVLPIRSWLEDLAQSFLEEVTHNSLKVVVPNLKISL